LFSELESGAGIVFFALKMPDSYRARTTVGYFLLSRNSFSAWVSNLFGTSELAPKLRYFVLQAVGFFLISPKTVVLFGKSFFTGNQLSNEVGSLRSDDSGQGIPATSNLTARQVTHSELQRVKLLNFGVVPRYGRRIRFGLRLRVSGQCSNPFE